MTPGATAEIAPALARALRAELGEFVAEAGTRRALPSTFHLGAPGGERIRIGTEATDASLQVELVSRMLEHALAQVGTPVAWLTRPGSLAPLPRDHAWLRATSLAAERHGADVPFFVLNRTGWLHLASGQRREWYRIRPTRAREPDLFW